MHTNNACINFLSYLTAFKVYSAYIVDIMALIDRHEWKMNMFGTAQENRTGGDTAEEKKAMKKNMNGSLMWQHGNEPLCYSTWFDNNFARTLSNFHTPKVVHAGVKRKRSV